MPITPLHFGPHACVALPLQRYIDLPVFVTANIAVDIEPLMVMLLQPNYPLHGYCHTFLVGGIVGLLWGALAYPFRNQITRVMTDLHLPYSAGIWKMLLSGILGVWLHVVFDAVLYREMKPFYPLAANPFLGIVSEWMVYLICGVCFIPAVVMYYILSAKIRKQAAHIE